MKNCRISLKQPEQATLKSAPFKRGCRYHRKQGQIFEKKNLCPKDFCPHAYAKIYPLALSFLYNPHLKSEKILCPNKDFQIEFLVSSSWSLPSIIRKAKVVTLSMLNKCGIATEFPDKKIEIKVVSQNPLCPKCFKTGKVFAFNIWQKEELCPASFYSLYPFYLKNNLPSFHCPDPEGICYQTQNGDFDCRQIITNYKVKKFSFCPLFTFLLYPYYRTLKMGGRFEWVIPGKNVQVQCPLNHGVAAEVFLSKKGQDQLCVKIVKLKGKCYLEIKEGKTFFLTVKDFNQVNSIIWNQKQP